MQKDLEARLEGLKALKYEDAGPIYDCVVFHDGKTWRAAIDISETGDFTTASPMASYREERQYGTFTPGLLNYSFSIYEDGNLVSIYCDTGAHGSHVAGIVAGHNVGQPDLDGVAPGAQIVGIKIGDTRLGSMETGTGLMRGLLAAIETKCDIVNMSYGEPSTTPNVGSFAALANQRVNKHNIIFVRRFAGPALPMLVPQAEPRHLSSL